MRLIIQVFTHFPVRQFEATSDVMRKSEKAVELLRWFDETKPTFDGLARVADSTLTNLIRKHKIPILSLSSRVKNSESIERKQARKQYKDPQREMTDFVGIRVITYIEDDARLVSDLVREAFFIEDSLTADKSAELGVDQVGYRSLHYVCTLGEARLKLPELDSYKGFCFEVQVRTVLQHAWAEVEHDRNYKFVGVLPKSLERRLYLISGLLEVSDRELNQLAKDIDNHVAIVTNKAKKGELDEELTSASFRAFLPTFLRGLKRTKVFHLNDPDTLNLALAECVDLGLRTIGDLKTVFTQDFLDALGQKVASSTDIGVVRNALMFSNIHRYFEQSWKSHWNCTSMDVVALLKKKYPLAIVRNVHAKYGIKVKDHNIDLARFASAEQIYP